MRTAETAVKKAVAKKAVKKTVAPTMTDQEFSDKYVGDLVEEIKTLRSPKIATDAIVSGLNDRIAALEAENIELKTKLVEAELAAVKTPTSGKPRKSRDVTDDDVLKIVKGKKGGSTVKALANLLGLTYGQVYSVYNGYTFTDISKIKA